MSDSVMTIDNRGNKHWKNSKGQFHRTGGPAIECLDGEKLWYMNGKLYRINGPAVEWQDGYKSWWVNGAFLGSNDEGFWKLWDKLTPEQKKDPVLLSYLPGDFHV